METRTIQIWPGGASYEYTGDPDGPAEQKQLRKGFTRSEGGSNRWRAGTAEEWRTIRVALRAEMYAQRDVLQCVSSLIDDLIKAANSGELRGDLAEGFGYDEIRNLYKDPSDWTLEQCQDYANDHGLELEPLPTLGESPQIDDDALEDEWLPAARQVCQEHAQDNPAEVYEWYLVDSWLCDQLHAIGEVTIDNGYGHFWGRTCTGQMLIMDGTLQEIAANFERGE